MKLKLVTHPGRNCPYVEAFEVRVRRAGNGLSLTYNVKGDMRDLKLPPKRAAGTQPERRDELWKTTCFEVFARVAGETRYVELNFAPDGDWAAYTFESYRTTMRNTEVQAPRIFFRRSMGWVELEAEARGIDLPADQPWEIAVTAVLQDIDEVRTYWALAHPAENPDFHHDGGFVARLEPV